jgi:lipid-A-disaccharide synthase
MPSSKRHSILMVAGEVSGDMHAAGVIRALKSKDSKLKIFGMGGPQMAGAGMDVREDLTKQALIGFWEVVKHYPWIKKRFDQCVDWLKQEKPDLLFLVDYPGFNLRLAEKAHELGIPVCYYVAPQVWAWHKSRITQIRRVVQKLLVILPFEEAFFKKEKVPAVYVGHPLLEEMTFKKLPRAKAMKAYGVEGERFPLVSVMPGSRQGEIEKLWPLCVAAARLLRKQYPDAGFVVPQPAGLSWGDYPGLNPDDSFFFVKAPAYDLRSVCDLAWVKSGTGTLETALLKTPMTVIYKVSALSGFLAKKFLTIPYVSLVNILAKKGLVTELLQEKATAEALVQEAVLILEGAQARQTQLKGFEAIRKSLAHSSMASANASREIFKMLEAKR